MEISLKMENGVWLVTEHSSYGNDVTSFDTLSNALRYMHTIALHDENMTMVFRGTNT